MDGYYLFLIIVLVPV